MVNLPFESFVNAQFDVFVNWFIYLVKVFVLLFPIVFVINFICYGFRFLFKRIKNNKFNKKDN